MIEALDIFIFLFVFYMPLQAHTLFFPIRSHKYFLAFQMKLIHFFSKKKKKEKYKVLVIDAMNFAYLHLSIFVFVWDVWRYTTKVLNMGTCSNKVFFLAVYFP